MISLTQKSLFLLEVKRERKQLKIKWYSSELELSLTRDFPVGFKGSVLSSEEIEAD